MLARATSAPATRVTKQFIPALRPLTFPLRRPPPTRGRCRWAPPPSAGPPPPRPTSEQQETIRVAAYYHTPPGIPWSLRLIAHAATTSACGVARGRTACTRAPTAAVPMHVPSLSTHLSLRAVRTCPRGPRSHNPYPCAQHIKGNFLPIPGPAPPHYPGWARTTCTRWCSPYPLHPAAWPAGLTYLTAHSSSPHPRLVPSPQAGRRAHILQASRTRTPAPSTTKTISPPSPPPPIPSPPGWARTTCTHWCSRWRTPRWTACPRARCWAPR